MRRSERRRDGSLTGADKGFVTAETAVAVPSLILLVALLMWGATAAAGMVQCVDGARAGARAAARGEPEESVREVARAVAPPGAQVTSRREGDLVRVTVEAMSAGPGALALPLDAEAVAFAEAREDAQPAAPPPVPPPSGPSSPGSD